MRGSATVDDASLLRYARHILLNEFGIEGQERVQAAHALVVGAGGLGSPVALYLAAAGIGCLTLVDDDAVDVSNLQRQILHRSDRVGQPKALSGRRTLLELNPGITVHARVERLADAALAALVAQADVVLDCSDNFATRHAINRACVQHRRPLVSGAAIRFDGQVSVFDLRDDAAPCYHCLFPEAQDVEVVHCATVGVFGPLVGMVGSAQAAEALKVLTGMGQTLAARLLMVDALRARWRTVGIVRDPTCAVCGQGRGSACHHTAP